MSLIISVFWIFGNKIFGEWGEFFISVMGFFMLTLL